VHPADQWTGRTRYTTGFGQGYSVTALQMVSAVGTFANDGVRMSPTLVAGTRGADGAFEAAPTQDGTRVVSSDTAATVLELMDNNIDDTEDSNAAVPGYAVGGKTGTAQVGDGSYTASFIGTAPVDDPDIVIGVFVYGLDTFISGNTVAAPAFSEIMGYALQKEGIAPTGVAGREMENEW
jgi:cell division protein FtsI (penicillin-binding protein 3)